MDKKDDLFKQVHELLLEEKQLLLHDIKTPRERGLKTQANESLDSVTSPIVQSNTLEGNDFKLLDYIVPPLIEPTENHGADGVASLHVFIDHSNFNFGAYSWIKAFKSSHSTDRKVQVNYDALLGLLKSGSTLAYAESGKNSVQSNYGCSSKEHFFNLETRPTFAKGVLVGSFPVSDDKLPDIASRHGFETRILQRVQKPVPATADALASADLNSKTEPESNKFYDSTPHYAPESLLQSSTFSSYARVARVNAPVFITVEQGVDELLALKMCDSLLDYMNRPGLLVLVTGDGAPGEFNPSGFLRYVQHALMLGWAVELWTWKISVSANYKRLFNKDLNFRICFFDNVCDIIMSNLN